MPNPAEDFRCCPPMISGILIEPQMRLFIITLWVAARAAVIRRTPHRVAMTVSPRAARRVLLLTAHTALP